LDNHENAAEYLELALEHAKQYDELPQEITFTSFLVRGYVFNRNQINSHSEWNEVKNLFKRYDTSSIYDKVRDMSWFKAILDKYRPYASENKSWK